MKFAEAYAGDVLCKALMETLGINLECVKEFHIHCVAPYPIVVDVKFLVKNDAGKLVTMSGQYNLVPIGDAIEEGAEEDTTCVQNGEFRTSQSIPKEDV